MPSDPWWMLGGGHGMSFQFFRAPTRRNALKQIRACLMDQFHGSGFSWRDAAFRVRDMELYVAEGPLTPQEAYELDISWTWAEAAADFLSGGIQLTAVRKLGEERVRRIDKHIRSRYGLGEEMNICATCRKEFETKDINDVYCSTDCAS